MKPNTQPAHIYEQVEQIKQMVFEDEYEYISSLSEESYKDYVIKHKTLNMYAKNLLALLHTNPKLGIKLAYSSQGEYEIYRSNDDKYNIINARTMAYVIGDINAHQKYWQDRFEKEFNRYQVLYFYGIGTGDIYTMLPSNIKKLVIFEDDINILYIAFNLNEYYKKIFGFDVMFFDKDMDEVQLHQLYIQDDIGSQVKLYDMLIYSEFYDSMSENITALNKKITEGFAKLVSANGNDVTDALIGVQNFMLSLASLPKSYVFEEMTELGKDGCKNAIIVSTGPSLNKQLNLLKEHQEKFYIISVDASFRILLEHGIMPDFVTSIERVVLTSKLFEKIPKVDVPYMVVSALTHPQTISNIFASENKLCLAFKPLSFELGFGLSDRGYLGYGMSAANIALELALKLGSKNIVFIGQDLAFGKDNSSHAIGHLLGSYYDSDKTEDATPIKGWYKDTAYTTYVWELFRSQLQMLILYYPDRDYYNCTEGGAWIEGCKHIEFAKFIATIGDTPPKRRIHAKLKSHEEAKKELEKIKTHIENLYKYEQKVSDQFRECFLQVASACEKLDADVKSVSINELIALNEKIESIKNIVEDEEFCKYYMEVVQPRLISFELDLAVIAAMSVNNDEDRFNKLVAWTQAHKVWLFNVYGAMDVVGENVRKYSHELIKTLKSYDIDASILEQEYQRVINA